MDIYIWEEERRTLTGRIGDMTEEMRTKDEEIEDLSCRVLGYEHTQWGAFCPVSLGIWAENCLNTI